MSTETVREDIMIAAEAEPSEAAETVVFQGDASDRASGAVKEFEPDFGRLAKLDGEEWDTWFAKKNPYLLKLATRRVGDPYTAEDLVQEGWTDLVEKFVDGEVVPGNLNGLITRIVTRKALDHLKNKTRQRTVITPDLAETAFPSGADTSEIVVQVDQNRRLAAAFSGLHPSHQAQLHSLAAGDEATGINSNAAKQARHRAVIKARDVIAGLYPQFSHPAPRRAVAS